MESFLIWYIQVLLVLVVAVPAILLVLAAILWLANKIRPNPTISKKTSQLATAGVAIFMIGGFSVFVLLAILSRATSNS